MSGETEKSVSGWTVDTLRESAFNRIAYLEARVIELVAAERALRVEAEKRYDDRFLSMEHSMSATIVAQKEALTAALASAEKAVAKSELEVKEWRMAANEWRGTISDRDMRLMPRLEGEQQIRAVGDKSEQNTKALAEKIDALDKRLDRGDGRHTGLTDGWKYLMAGFTLLVTLATLWNMFKH